MKTETQHPPRSIAPHDVRYDKPPFAPWTDTGDGSIINSLGEIIADANSPELRDLIIRCVNTHAALVEALEACITSPGAMAERSHEFAMKRLRAISDHARAALDRAKQS